MRERMTTPSKNKNNSKWGGNARQIHSLFVFAYAYLDNVQYLRRYIVAKD